MHQFHWTLRRSLGLLITAAACTLLAPRSLWGATDSADRHERRTDAGLRGHGFVRDSGDRVTTIDIPDARSFTVVFGINSSGEGAGGYADESGQLHGFRQRHGTVSVIDFPGATGTIVTRINDAGQIVGACGNESNVPALELPHGFLLDHGVFTPIDVPGAVETRPFSINNKGQIVGEYVDAPDSTSTWVEAIPFDIGDHGRIAGFHF
jgi:uncharacterized membrane protein